MNGFAGVPVTRLRSTPGGFDAYGDPIASTDTRTTLDGCLLAPRYDQSEGIGEGDTRGRNGVVVGLTLYAPLGSDVRHDDRFEIDDRVWEVEGEPGSWPDVTGSGVGGVEVVLRRAVG